MKYEQLIQLSKQSEDGLLILKDLEEETGIKYFLKRKFKFHKPYHSYSSKTSSSNNGYKTSFCLSNDLRHLICSCSGYNYISRSLAYQY